MKKKTNDCSKKREKKKKKGSNSYIIIINGINYIVNGFLLRFDAYTVYYNNNMTTYFHYYCYRTSDCALIINSMKRIVGAVSLVTWYSDYRDIRSGKIVRYKRPTTTIITANPKPRIFSVIVIFVAVNYF